MSKKKFFDHFKELNSRIFLSFLNLLVFFVFIYFNYSSVYDILIQPLIQAGYSETDLFAFTIYEGFQVKLINSLYVSLISSLPINLIILGYFFQPAIENLSRLKFLIFMLISIILFYVGLLISYELLPHAIKFFLSFNESDFILRTQNYFQLVFRIALLFGVTFEIPLVIYFLLNRGIIDITKIKKLRKEIFLVILIFSAIITPTGDPVSLFALTIPLYLFIEFVIFLNIKSKNNET